MARPVLPLPTGSGAITVEQVTKRSTPFVEMAAPIAVLLFLKKTDTPRRRHDCPLLR